MKFVVSNTDLLNHLQTLSKVISAKSQLPILNDFLFTVQDQTLGIRAADMETSMTTTVNLTSVESDGSVAIPAKFLLDLLSTTAVSDQPLTFDINDETFNIVIYSENGQYSFAGHNSVEFPKAVECGDDLESFDIQPDAFLNAFSRTLFATGEDEYRPVMSGILVELGECITFVSSDAHRLVRYRYNPEPGDAPMQGSFIIHKKPAGLLKNILAKAEQPVHVSFNSKNAFFQVDDYTVSCRLIEGKFPNYNSVIPQNNPNIVTIDRLALINSLTRVQVFSSRSISLVTLDISENQMIIQAQDTDYAASGKEVMKCQYEGDDLIIGFKSTFLIDILSNLTSAEVQIQLSDNARPCIIVPAGEENPEDVLMLLMPMKI